MTGTKFTKLGLPVIAVCLMASAAMAQTPAQDAAVISTAQKNVDALKEAVKNDAAQLEADKARESAAELRFKAALARQGADNERFNGAVEETTPPPAQPATAAGITGNAPGAAPPTASLATPEPVGTPPAISGTVGTPPVVAPATNAPTTTAPAQ